MNLGIEDSAITAHTHVGALAGKTMNAVIMNCYSNATVKVSGAKDVGGIVGMFNSSQMNNCYSAATVNATQESAGGLTGSLNSSLNLNNLVSVDNVYSIATVSAPKNVGIITGWDEGYSTETPVNVTNAYYFGDKNASGNYAARNATLLTEVQITDGTLLTYLNKDLKDKYEPWVEDAQGYPSFRYQIYDVSELEALLAAASKIDSTIYTEETINTLEEAIKKGEDSLIPESQEQLDNAVKALEEALNLLVYKPADYSEVDKAVAKASALDKDLYKDYSLVEIAINAIVRGKNITEQKEVDAMAKAIEDAIGALEYKDADYSKVNDAVTKANGLNKDLYKDFSAVEKALEAVNPDLDITQQEEVDAMAKAIEDAISALEYKDADYSAVEKAKEKVPADLSIYTEESVKALNDALAGVVEGKNITEQEEVDAMAKAIENAINGLVKKDTGKPEDPTTPTDPETPSEPEGPNTSDNYHVAVFAGLMILSAGVLAFVLLRKKREARQ